MECITLNSNAKINLGLFIKAKRGDGYHEIETIFQEIDLCDTMTFQKTSGSIPITSNDASLPVDAENLAHRAFVRYREETGIKGGLSIHIEKRIPMGGGLGGGSSNAAMTLVAANRFYPQLSQSEIEEIAAEIGSDVPFFLHGGTAVGRGRGEKLEALSRSPDCWIVVVCPGIHVSTAWAYAQAKIALTKVEKFANFGSILDMYSPHALKTNVFNEFEGVVFQRHPILRGIKESLYERDAFYASMSGSGSSMYGFFHREEDASSAKLFFAMEGVTAFLCRPISTGSSIGALSVDYDPG